MDVTREQLVDALQEFHLWITPDRTQTIEARSVFGTVQAPESFADGLLLALRANAAHQDGEVVDADIPDPEVTAIAAIVAAMDALDGETALLGTDVHERVIRWAMARYLGPVSG